MLHVPITSGCAKFERAFHEGRDCGFREDLCPCLCTLITECDFEPYEALKFVGGFQCTKRAQGLPIEFECDHSSPVGCLAAAQATREAHGKVAYGCSPGRRTTMSCG